MKQRCPECGKMFKCVEAHALIKHGTTRPKGRQQRREPRNDDDESFASRAIQAEIDRACGIPNDDIDWLIP